MKRSITFTFVVVFATVLCCLATFCLSEQNTASKNDEDVVSDDCPSAPSLTRSSFKEAILSGDVFIMFFAPWCGHCKRMKPIWEELAAKVNADASKPVQVAKVDCTEETVLCSEEEVKGYPTLMYYDDADPGDGDKYSGPRTVEEFEKFINEQLNSAMDDDSSELDEDDGLYELTARTFHPHVDEGDHFIKFYAPWCGHCKKMAPAWKELAKTFEDHPGLSIGNVDCTQHNQVCANFDVKGFPTLIYLRSGRVEERYQGERDYETLLKFANEMLSKQKEDKPADHDDGRIPEAPSVPEEAVLEEVTVLTDETFNGEIAEDKLTFVKFYAPWCGHCKRLAPTWDQLAKMFSGIAEVTIAKVDCTQEEAVCSVQEVQGYPTLYLYKLGDKVEQYKGDRTIDSLVKFINSHRGRDEL